VLACVRFCMHTSCVCVCVCVWGSAARAKHSGPCPSLFLSLINRHSFVWGTQLVHTLLEQSGLMAMLSGDGGVGALRDPAREAAVIKSGKLVHVLPHVLMN
jgi:hypothetical protein